MNREVLSILAHKAVNDTIFYRVQWTDKTCLWLPGRLLNNDHNRKWLQWYWTSQDIAVKDISTQTDPAFGFELSHVIEDLVSPACTFAVFPPSAPPVSLLPVEIVSIDFAAGKAMVKMAKEAECVEMSVDELKDAAPLLVCEYCLKHFA